MLTTIEVQIAQKIYLETTSIDLAVTAIAIRRLFPQLEMKAINVGGMFGEISTDIEKLTGLSHDNS